MSGTQTRFPIIAVGLLAVIILALAAGCTTHETKVPVVMQTPAANPVTAGSAGTAAVPSAAPVTVAAASGERQTIKISGST
ncbi:MAG TPA: hypothetical protein VLL74_01245, partial [Methanoregula sp.]|nr:hypothetical protein [Methanoregula sp.]